MANRPCKNCIHEEACKTANPDMVKKTYQCKHYKSTADVAELKHGEWDVNVGMNFNKERICPICKKRIESNYWEFCSHCGAKMDSQL